MVARLPIRLSVVQMSRPSRHVGLLRSANGRDRLPPSVVSVPLPLPPWHTRAHCRQPCLGSLVAGKAERLKRFPWSRLSSPEACDACVTGAEWVQVGCSLPGRGACGVDRRVRCDASGRSDVGRAWTRNMPNGSLMHQQISGLDASNIRRRFATIALSLLVPPRVRVNTRPNPHRGRILTDCLWPCTSNHSYPAMATSFSPADSRTTRAGVRRYRSPALSPYHILAGVCDSASLFV